MYRRFYGLRDRPFDLTPNPQFLVLTSGHREALSHFEYAISSRKGMTLLIGEAGTGKTTVIATALQRRPAQTHCVHLQNPVLTRPEFVEILAAKFGLSPAARTSKATLLMELETLLLDRHRRGEATVLVVDEAQSLPLELLEELRLLANIETLEGKLLSVVLAGQPELAARLNEEDLRQLKQRIALRCELKPLTLEETLAYVAGRIRAAGGVAAQLFTREAVMLMHEQSRGIPRTISVIADNTLVSGFAQGQRPVPAATVAEVCRDLDLGDPAVREEVPAAAETVQAEAEPEAALPAPRVLSFANTVPADTDDTTSVTPQPSGEESEPVASGESKRRLFRFF